MVRGLRSMDCRSSCAAATTRSLAAAAEQIAPAVAAAVERYGAHRVAVTIGSSTSGISESEGAIRCLLANGRLPSGFHLAQQELASPARMLAHVFGVSGPAHVISSACASSAKALASAARLLELGVADAVVTGGVDTLGAFTLAGFDSLQLVSAHRCNPLSANRNGINLGEGAALFLMTREPATVACAGGERRPTAITSRRPIRRESAPASRWSKR